MRILLQRVTEASVTIDGNIVGHIKGGYLLFLGVFTGDTEAQADHLAEKITKLRLFDSDGGKVNDRSLLDVGGEILVVSQFTLAGNFEIFSASSFGTPSLITFGALSTAALASPRGRPVISRTALITAIF